MHVVQFWYFLNENSVIWYIQVSVIDNLIYKTGLYNFTRDVLDYKKISKKLSLVVKKKY
jgi:hypothetical protein